MTELKIECKYPNEMITESDPASYSVIYGDYEYRSFNVLDAVRVFGTHLDDEGGAELSLNRPDGSHEVLAAHGCDPFQHADERILALEEQVRKLTTDIGFLVFDVQYIQHKMRKQEAGDESKTAAEPQ